MSAVLLTDNIDRLQAIALDTPRGWKISFRSTNEGLHHQLYVNGQLADWADTVEQRSFFLDAERFPHELIIAAVDSENRTVDMSGQLPTALQQPPWVYRATVVRALKHSTSSRVAVLGDHATGQVDPQPLVLRELYPDCLSRWGFGEDAFGMGGLGYNGTTAPGLGKGAFGAGPFGIESSAMSISVPLAEEGTHQILLRVISESGEYADGTIQNIPAWPPPQPPASLQATGYDAQTNTLTLQIQ